MELAEIAAAAARAGGALLVDAFARRDELVVEVKSRNDFVSRADRDSEEAIVAVLQQRLGERVGRILGEEGGVRGAGELEWILDPLDGTTNFLEGLPIWCVSVAARFRGELVAGVVHEPLSGAVYLAARGGGAWLEKVTPDGAREPGDGDAGAQAPSRVRLRVGDKAPRDAFLSTGFPFRAHTVIDQFLALFRLALLGSRAIRRCGAAALDLAHVAAGIYDGFFEFRLSPWDVAAAALLIREAGGVVTDLDGGERWLDSGNILAGNPEVHAQLLEWAGTVTSQEAIERAVP
ncbi:MAG: inositol monophosphatase [Acidobacteria bacterium]|nr:MAG: inositol monophosphatase [Acidobacteriota bacterium]REK04631.1 MAG: inositol monophosphatase [Acidobacteriota bacterium]